MEFHVTYKHVYCSLYYYWDYILEIDFLAILMLYYFPWKLLALVFFASCFLLYILFTILQVKKVQRNWGLFFINKWDKQKETKEMVFTCKQIMMISLPSGYIHSPVGLNISFIKWETDNARPSGYVLP